jgi:hypothetical protein
MLRKSTASVPRYQKFESISLQRRVRCEPDFLSRVDHAGEVLDVLVMQFVGAEGTVLECAPR